MDMAASGIPSERMLRSLGDLAIDMQQAHQGEDTLTSVTAAAVRLIPGVRWAWISLVHGNRVTLRAPTDEVVAELDTQQTAIDDGPCLTALRNHDTVHIDDMTAEQRWPRFRQLALDRGVKSLLSFQLFVTSENLGALNLYAGEPYVFDGESMLIGEVLAQHASVALAGSAAEGQFETALASRDLIGQAKGIVMHRASVDALQAFQMLTRLSQDTNTKLVEVARLVVDDHLRSCDTPRQGHKVLSRA